MGKRSNFKRRASDLYRTPEDGVLPLLRFLPGRVRFAEPCAANGMLVDALQKHGHSAHFIGDLVPGRGDVVQTNALNWRPMSRLLRPITHIITNPPWRRDLLHKMIEHFSSMLPTWLLFDADWVHTIQSAPYQPLLRKVVSVGRLKWIPGSAHTGKDNCAWHLFDARSEGQTQLYRRAA